MQAPIRPVNETPRFSKAFRIAFRPSKPRSRENNGAMCPDRSNCTMKL